MKIPVLFFFLLCLLSCSDRCVSNWLPRIIGDNASSVYFSCMEVVNGEVLVFGYSDSLDLTGSGTQFPIFIRLKQNDLSIIDGFSFQASNTILSKFHKCAASSQYQVGIEATVSSFLFSEELSAGTSSPEYGVYRLKTIDNLDMSSNAVPEIVGGKLYMVGKVEARFSDDIVFLKIDLATRSMEIAARIDYHGDNDIKRNEMTLQLFFLLDSPLGDPEIVVMSNTPLKTGDEKYMLMRLNMSNNIGDIRWSGSFETT